jgi:diphthine-ammonia ligase
MMQLGFQLFIIEVDTSLGSRKNWLGKTLDDYIFREIQELEGKQSIHPTGELGEYHTLVLDCPLYKKRLEILDSEIIWEGSKGYVVVKNAKLQSNLPSEV